MSPTAHPTILVIGKSGQLARVLQAESAFWPYHVTCIGRDICDLSGPNAAILEALAPYKTACAVINAAAYTQVDKAEDEPDLAMQINGHAPGVIAGFCQRLNIPLIHISTDYVFNGRGRNGSGRTAYRPSDPTAPMNAYGLSKRAGEKAVMAYAGGAVLRASWLFDGYGDNFFTKMIELAKTRSELSIVSDQIGRPVDTTSLAKACFSVVSNHSHSIYHIACNGAETSWAGFAKAIFRAAPPAVLPDIAVTNIAAKDYKTKAVRPAYSVLDNRKFQQDYQTRLPDWRDMIDLAWQQYLTVHPS